AAETMARAARLTIFPLPFPVPPFDVKIYGHQRSGKREATRWLISLLQTLVGESTAS
ncbi:LysR family transcriptional regulator, partial [Klebsiella pneumoniae]